MIHNEEQDVATHYLRKMSKSLEQISEDNANTVDGENEGNAAQT